MQLVVRTWITLPGLGALTTLVLGCGTGPALDSAGRQESPPRRAAMSAPPIFEEMTTEAGLAIEHNPGPLGEFPMPQIMGSGGALLDVNGDDRLDILTVSGEPGGDCPLFLQQPDGHFRNVTAEAGLKIGGYGMGVAAADVDNDGDIDVLITAVGACRLFLNDGAAHFSDITDAAGIVDPRWSTAAAFFDYDRDGWLDLVVVNYVDYLPGSACQDATGRRDYCGPQPFPGTVDRLYRNLGGGGRAAEFEDVTAASGLVRGPGKGLGVVCGDFTDDGLPDIYIANDQEPNRLWVQQPGSMFLDEAVLRGCATDLHGQPQASMGTAWSDFTPDGRCELFLTHLRGETNTLYRQLAAGLFVDATSESGLGAQSLNETGFGVAACDLELDGDLDLVIANGRVMRSPLAVLPPSASHWDQYAERNQIFINGGQGEFANWTIADEPFTQPVEVSRGLAAGDVDNDGRIDILLTNVAGPARLYHNVAERRGHWVTLKVVDPERRRDALGARVRLRAGGHTWFREVAPHSGYLTSHDPRVHFGLGPVETIEAIEIDWPDGPPGRERFPGGAVDRIMEVRRGEGTVVSAAPRNAPP